jgi:hypothetical protein
MLLLLTQSRLTLGQEFGGYAQQVRCGKTHSYFVQSGAPAVCRLLMSLLAALYAQGGGVEQTRLALAGLV